MEEKRFSFGKNWLSFIEILDEDRINTAVESLKEMLEEDNLSGKTFLDIGCGSGLFSLAAVRLKAKVFSFDYDKQSVACANKLKRKFNIDDNVWQIEYGSVLDSNYMSSLGSFDIVYSWGVLHHTGDMKTAIINAASKTSPGGKLFISIYNDQGIISLMWKAVKKTYCSSYLGKIFITLIFVPMFFLSYVLVGIIKKGNPFYYFLSYKKNRGMSVYHDLIDWLGGYPFETATAAQIERMLNKEGFEIKKKKLSRRWGCNQFVFIKKP